MAQGVGQLILGDARNLKKHSRRFALRPKAIITSPPYLDVQDYGEQRQIGFGQTRENYLSDLQAVFKACWNISDPDATLWIVVGALRREGRLIQLPEIVTTVVAKAGWIPREQVTWAKGKSLPWTKRGEFRDVTEQAILFSKSESYLFNLDDLLSPDPTSSWWRRYPERYSPQGRRPTNLWDIPIPTQGAWREGPGHLCPFPHELTFRMIYLATNSGDAVLDPFAGIGSVPAMASAMGRIGYGVELSRNYVNRFHDTVQQSIVWYEQKSNELSEAQIRSAIFRDTIVQLRLLKFGRIVAQMMTHKGYVIEWIHVGRSTEEPTETHKVVVGRFNIKLASRRALDPALALLKNHLCKRPLSKFGVQPEFNVSSANSSVSSRYWYEDTKFWLRPSVTRPSGLGPHLSSDFYPRIDDVFELSSRTAELGPSDGQEDWD